MIQPRLNDEPGRLAAVHRLRVLDTAPEAPFDRIVELVRSVLGVPMATVTLIDADRQWFKAHGGMPTSGGPRATAFCAHAIQQAGPLLISNASEDARFAASPLVLGDPHIRSYAGVPLTTPDGYNVGALCAIDTVPREFAEQQVAVLAQLAGLVVNELELRQIATHDEGTGALSRRGFLAAAETEFERARRSGRAPGIIVFDVDHFKRVNDSHGHPAGDAVLREIVARCRDCLRPSDTIGRVGGEEFAVLLPETAPDEALAVAERARAAFAETPFTLPDGRALAVSASFGVAGCAVTSRPEIAIAEADAALYAAKRDGRNRCILARTPERAAA